MIVTFIFLGLLISCKEPEQNPEENNTSDRSAEPTQEQIEDMAEQSILDIYVEEDFVFENQRTVAIDLRFTQRQDMQVISIYASYDHTTQTPVKLLERGDLNNLIRYRGMLSLSNEFTTLFVVRNNALSSLIEIPISKNNTASYNFED